MGFLGFESFAMENLSIINEDNKEEVNKEDEKDM